MMKGFCLSTFFLFTEYGLREPGVYAHGHSVGSLGRDIALSSYVQLKNVGYKRHTLHFQTEAVLVGVEPGSWSLLLGKGIQEKIIPNIETSRCLVSVLCVPLLYRRSELGYLSPLSLRYTTHLDIEMKKNLNMLAYFCVTLGL